MPNPPSSSDIVFLVAPYCFNAKSCWYSPGRLQKLLQVESLLASLNCSIYRINTAPDICLDTQIPCLQLSTLGLPLVRLLHSSFSLLLFLSRWRFGSHSPKLWIYNIRFSESLIAIILLAFKPSLSVYLQLEDLPFARPKNSGLRGIIDYFCLYYFVRRADYVFVVSQPVGHTLQQMARINLPSVSILPPLLSPSFLSAVQQRERPFSQPNLTILYAGGYGAEKGVEDLISAFLMLPNKDAILQLIGSPPDSFVSAYSSIPGIHFIGHISNSALYRHYACADIVVCPHHLSGRPADIFPFKLIEYASSGSLIFTTRIPGAELLQLPEACFFDTVSELSSKLAEAESIWKLHDKALLESASLLRSHYSFSSYLPSLSRILDLPHVARPL
jgi:glycosyltransferase involved in cell wall biosynthesis